MTWGFAGFYSAARSSRADMTDDNAALYSSVVELSEVEGTMLYGRIKNVHVKPPQINFPMTRPREKNQNCAGCPIVDKIDGYKVFPNRHN